jgi:integrase/recombinase XerD
MPGLADIVLETVRLWRKHHLGYDQTKYVVEQVRRRLKLGPPGIRRRTVDRLDKSEVERLIRSTYQSHNKYGLMIKTLFLSGARVDEFVHIRVEHLHLDGDPPQIYLSYCKKESNRYVPVLPALAQELRTHLNGRRSGYLFETNRNDRYSVRTVQSIVKSEAREAGIDKRVYPHLLRHSIATILLDSGEVPIDQVQKFLGHLQLSTTQIYAETSIRALGENYRRRRPRPPSHQRSLMSVLEFRSKPQTSWRAGLTVRLVIATRCGVSWRAWHREHAGAGRGHQSKSTPPLTFEFLIVTPPVQEKRHRPWPDSPGSDAAVLAPPDVA